MASNNLPKSPATFNTWFANFHKTFTAKHKKHGFTASDLKNFNNVYKAWQQSYSAYNSFNQFVNSWNQVNAQQFASLQAFVAAYWNAFQQSTPSNSANKTTKKSSPRAKKTTAKRTTKPIAKKTVTKAAKPTATNAQKKAANSSSSIKSKSAQRSVKATTPKKAAAKATVRKSPKTAVRTASKTAAKSNSSFAAPSVWLTNGKKAGQISVYVGTTKNGGFHLPTGAKAAFVQYRTTGRAWRTLTQSAKFPFTHNFNGRKVWYRACWIGNNGKNGAWSKGVTYVVAPSKKAA